MTQIEMDVMRSTIKKNKAVFRSLEDVDWERRRYEIAKDVLPFALEVTAEIRGASLQVSGMDDAVTLAVAAADSLIRELKKQS